jgi:hypothetical protein
MRRLHGAILALLTIVQFVQKQLEKISDFHKLKRRKIFEKLLHFWGVWCIIVRHDVRRCERLLTGGSDPCEGIFTEYVRKSGESIVSMLLALLMAL